MSSKCCFQYIKMDSYNIFLDIKLVHTRTFTDVTTRCFGSFPFTSIPTLTLPGLLPSTTSTGPATGIPGSPRRPNYNQYNNNRNPSLVGRRMFMRCCLYFVLTRTSSGITDLCFPRVSPTSFTVLTLPCLFPYTTSTGPATGGPGFPRRPNYNQYKTIRNPSLITRRML